MKKVLYIISRKPSSRIRQFLVSSPSGLSHVSAIMIQEGVRLNNEWPFPCYVLEDDIARNDPAHSFSKIKYVDMLTMIFEAETVIAI
mgnify:CR=1 FL=1